MSFLTDQMKELAPADVQGFRKRVSDYVGSSGLDTAMPSTTDLTPFREAFAKTRAGALAQAKESSGNLTGSGYANTMGTAAGRSAYEENAFLAQLMEQSRQANASRFLSMMGLIPQSAGTMAYQPGFLDYVMQGAKAAAPMLAGGTPMPRVSAAAGPGMADTEEWRKPVAGGYYR